MDLEEIGTKLDGIKETCDNILIWKAVHEQTHVQLGRDVKEVREVLFDNPGGLKSKVEALWNCKKNLATWRGFWMAILRYLIAAGIVSLAVWLFSIYKGN